MRVTGGGIPDTKDWKPTEEALLALNETEAIEGHSGPFESEDVIADEPLPSTSAGSVARPIPLTRTHDEHEPLPTRDRKKARTTEVAQAKRLMLEAGHAGGHMLSGLVYVGDGWGCLVAGLREDDVACRLV
ncbi:hypothetical protein Pmani_008932 [Petrolisthes manimaculis]|uniref:Uncharacterized protein n=1 Tax=Petrolisthes manimaculis TaxID=1843537 RepID=A0AAE1Q5B9_9EUCA|nr:hypothetical protein Pmani_008932 [Petrolisthes manimaculis]